LGAFGNTVGGFPAQSVTVLMKVPFEEKWDCNLSETFSILAAGHHPETGSRAEIVLHFGDGWHALAGTEYDTSIILTAWLGVVGLGWGF
jgi:hypothetical protein